MIISLPRVFKYIIRGNNWDIIIFPTIPGLHIIIIFHLWHWRDNNYLSFFHEVRVIFLTLPWGGNYFPFQADLGVIIHPLLFFNEVISFIYLLVPFLCLVVIIISLVWPYLRWLLVPNSGLEMREFPAEFAVLGGWSLRIINKVLSDM